jgi:hypothetical protein
LLKSAVLNVNTGYKKHPHLPQKPSTVSAEKANYTPLTHTRQDYLVIFFFGTFSLFYYHSSSILGLKTNV